MRRQLPGKPDGTNPLIYTGSVPNLVVMHRRPTVQDGLNWPLGYWWIIEKDATFTTGEVWILVSVSQSIATWKRLGGGSAAGVESLTGNTGGPVDPLDGNINVIGSGNVVVTGTPANNTLTITTTGGGGGISLINKVYLTSVGVGTYNVPSNLIQANVECVGGGGGSSGVQEYYGFPGAGGGYCAKLFLKSQLGSSVSYTIGGGGSGGTGGATPSAGGTGGTTSFGAFMSANGGQGGSTTGAGYLSASGGSASGGDINIKGGDAPIESVTGQNINIAPQMSGGSMYGMPTCIELSGTGGSSPATGGNLYGGGAAPAFYNTPTQGPGADGASGIIIITEYLA